MIFDLRNTPDQGGDVYSFEFNPVKLSTVQLNIIRDWVRGGRKILLWGSDQMKTYFPIFPDAGKYHFSLIEKRIILTRHPVNTDVARVDFRKKFNAGRFTVDTGTGGVLEAPHDAEIIVEAGKLIVAGRIPYGKGSIYFAAIGENWDSGADKDRWTLNFYQWMLGLNVPGAPEPSVNSTSSGTSEEPLDRIYLRNGDTVAGQLLIDKFSIKTSYAELSFKTREVETVIMEGGGQNIEILVLRKGGKVSGIISPSKIKLKLSEGQEAEIEKEKIKQIFLHQ